MGAKSLLRFAVVLCGLCAVCPAWGIVLHPDNEPNLITWTDRPEPNSVGRWSSNGSCVAISSNSIITTRHQGGGVGTSVWLADIEYTVEEIINALNDVDLRLCRVKRTVPGPTYLKYVPLYTLTDERRKELVIGGYGSGRGNPISDGNGDGYLWTGDNQTQRWGTNKILNLNWYTVVDIGTYISDTIISTFDPYNTTDYEAAVARYDSGGGWFIKNTSSGEWFLAALSAYVEYNLASYYSPAEGQYGIRISSYQNWISQSIPTRLDGDYSGDYKVDIVDFSILASNWQRQDCLINNNCDGVDSDLNGNVDIDDLAVFLGNWLNEL